MKEVATQFGIAFEADFEEGTWTFKMPDKYNAWAGHFAIVDKQVYNKMITVLQRINNALLQDGLDEDSNSDSNFISGWQTCYKSLKGDEEEISGILKNQPSLF